MYVCMYVGEYTYMVGWMGRQIFSSPCQDAAFDNESNQSVDPLARCYLWGLMQRVSWPWLCNLGGEGRRRKPFSWLRVPQLRIPCFSIANSGLLVIRRRTESGYMISEFRRVWKEAVEVCSNIVNKVPNVLVVSGSNLGSECGFHWDHSYVFILIKQLLR
jgi:hypothetical protein